jgi:hypothetical protein
LNAEREKIILWISGSIFTAAGRGGWSQRSLCPHRKNLPASLPAGLHRTCKENVMSQSTHDRAAELHNLAAHAHAVAAEAHGKADHPTAHELSRQAHEHSQNAYKYSAQLAEEAEKSTKK